MVRCATLPRCIWGGHPPAPPAPPVHPAPTSCAATYSSSRAASSAFLPVVARSRFFSSSLSLATVRPPIHSVPMAGRVRHSQLLLQAQAWGGRAGSGQSSQCPAVVMALMWGSALGRGQRVASWEDGSHFQVRQLASSARNAPKKLTGACRVEREEQRAGKEEEPAGGSSPLPAKL